MSNTPYAVRQVADNGEVVLTVYLRKEDTPPEAVPLVIRIITEDTDAQSYSS